MDELITLADLAERSGVPARTIRFYIARGLLGGPAKAGRGAGYTDAHLKRLEEIQRLQAEGRTLAEIRSRVGEASGLRQAPAVPWWQYVVAEDVAVWVRADVGPWRARQIRRAVDQLTAALARPANDDGRNDQ